MKIKQKISIWILLGIFILSICTVNANSNKIIIHIQTYGYEGRDLLKLNAEITGEDSDSFYITLNPGMLNKLSKQINIEKLPITTQGDVYVVPKAYLTEIGTNEYLVVVPNDVCKIKWNILDKIDGKGKDEIVSVIVMYKGDKNPAMLNKYGKITYEFLAGDGAAMDVATGNIKALSEEPGVLFVEDNAIVQACLSDSVPLINADDVWSAGYDGTGITICIIGTGINANHCDFPSWKMIGWKDYVNEEFDYYDDHGHGTHCASIAAGYDSPKGVAPGAYLMGAKVLDSTGQGCFEWIIMGIEWAVYNGTDIINLSLSGAGGDGTSSLAQKSNWAVDQGVIVVAAAGNDGACCTIGTPGDATKVITVASSTKSDSLSSFSSRGPTIDGRTKPDITAPGSSIYAADADTSCSDVGMSGTSMATSHIAGVCALMLDANGLVTPLQVKNVLGYTAIDKYNTGKDALWGWGRVDAYAAVNQIMSNPNVSPPADASDIGCSCGNPPLCIEIATPPSGCCSSCTVDITTNTSEEVTVVEFYIDDNWLYTDTEAPFSCQWDTCTYSNGYHVIKANAYGAGTLMESGKILDVPICSDEIGVYVNNECLEITAPSDEEEIYGTYLVTTNASCCIDKVEFYINDVYKDTDFSSPFQFYWDTLLYEEDEQYTIEVKGFYNGVLKCSDQATVTVNNYFVKITNPQNNETVADTVIITVDSRGVEEVQFYIGEYCMGKDDVLPFEYTWDTTQYPNGTFNITVKGFDSIYNKDEDTISCTISNGSALIFLGMLFGCAGLVIRKN